MGLKTSAIALTFLLTACAPSRPNEPGSVISPPATSADLTEDMALELVRHWIGQRGTVTKVVWIDQKAESALVRLRVVNFTYTTKTGTEHYCGFCEGEFIQDPKDNRWSLIRFRTVPRDSVDAQVWNVDRKP